MRDITTGDCFELTTALREHHFAGQRGQAAVLHDAEEERCASSCGARAAEGAAAGRPPQNAEIHSMVSGDGIAYA